MRRRFLLAVAGCAFALVAAVPAGLTAAIDTKAVIKLQREILGVLTGHDEIRPGVKLADRSTPDSRQAARAYLVQQLKEPGLDARLHEYQATDRRGQPLEGANIFALLACGRPSAEAVVFGAHYDSVAGAPGANDDGTGVAAVVAVAREMAKNKPKTRDLYVVLFDQEERGLVGAAAFARKLKDEGRTVHSVHTIDQMGWDSNHNRAIELELPYDGAVDLYKQSADALKMKIQMFTTTERGSDHDAFRRAGFNAIGITEEYHHNDTTPFYHKPGDTFATVDFDYLANTTALMAEVMRRLTR